MLLSIFSIFKMQHCPHFLSCHQALETSNTSWCERTQWQENEMMGCNKFCDNCEDCDGDLFLSHDENVTTDWKCTVQTCCHTVGQLHFHWHEELHLKHTLKMNLCQIVVGEMKFKIKLQLDLPTIFDNVNFAGQSMKHWKPPSKASLLNFSVLGQKLC